MSQDKPSQQTPLPETGGFLLRFFRWHFPKFLAKNFGALWIEKSSLERIREVEGGAVVFFNHPSWWDAVLGPVISYRLFPKARHFAPIDAEAVERYGFMKKIGFFGIDSESGRGLRDFVRIGKCVLETNDAFLWVTPQGKFTDSRDRPVHFKPGIGHLASRASSGFLIPMALEYVLGEERWPDVFCRFGEPILLSSEKEFTAAEWTCRLESALENCQEKLAVLTKERNFEAFEPLIEGRRGTGGIYGLWQRLKAFVRGEKFDPRHASIDEAKKLRSAPPS
ncbi:MAG: lysophospholipid acyltransferase family protein [Verrucomicrobiota bacterium]